MKKLDKICDYIEKNIDAIRVYDAKMVHTNDIGTKFFSTTYYYEKTKCRYELSILNNHEYVRKYVKINGEDWVLKNSAIGTVKGDINITNILLLLNSYIVPIIYSADSFGLEYFTHQDKLYVNVDTGLNNIEIETSKDNIVIKRRIDSEDKRFIVVDIKDKDENNISERYIISLDERMFIAYKYDEYSFTGDCMSIEYVFTDDKSPIDSIYLIPSEENTGEFVVAEINYRNSSIKEGDIGIFNDRLTKYDDLQIDDNIYLRTNSLYTGYDPFNNGICDFNSRYIEVFYSNEKTDPNTINENVFKTIVFKVDESIDCKELCNKIKGVLKYLPDEILQDTSNKR